MTDLNLIKSLRRKKNKAKKRVNTRKNKENYYSELDLDLKKKRICSNENDDPKDKSKKVRFADEEPDGKLENVSVFTHNQIISAPLKIIKPKNVIIEKQQIEHESEVTTHFSKKMNEFICHMCISSCAPDSSDLTSLGALENYFNSSLDSMKANNEGKKMRAFSIINNLKSFKENSLQSIQIWKEEMIQIVSLEESKLTNKVNDMIKQKQTVFEESVKFLNDFDSSKTKIIYKNPTEFYDFNTEKEMIDFMQQISNFPHILTEKENHLLNISNCEQQIKNEIEVIMKQKDIIKSNVLNALKFDNIQSKIPSQKSSPVIQENYTLSLNKALSQMLLETENIPPKQKEIEKVNKIGLSELSKSNANVSEEKENNLNVTSNFMFQNPVKKQNIEGNAANISKLECVINDGNIDSKENLPYKTFIKPSANKEQDENNLNEERDDEERNNILSQIPIRDYLNMNAAFMIQSNTFLLVYFNIRCYSNI